MEKPFKILVATDFSDAAANASRYAIRFAKQTGASISFVHIYSIPLSLPVGALDYARATEQLRKNELKRLEQHCYELFHSSHVSVDDVHCECLVREGSAGSGIKKIAAHDKADLIIVGAHGASSFREVFYGSHTWDVIRHSGIPVLAIPENALFTGIHKMVFATEYREGERAAIDSIVKFAQQFDAEVILLHISNSMLPNGSELEQFKKFKDRIQGSIHYGKLDIQLVHYAEVLSGLNIFCESNNTDILIMSPERALFLERIFTPKPSMTRQVSFHTHIPLLAMPDFFKAEDSEFWGRVKAHHTPSL